MEKDLKFGNEKEIREYIKKMSFYDVQSTLEELMIEKYLNKKEVVETPKMTITIEEFLQHFQLRGNRRGRMTLDEKDSNRRTFSILCNYFRQQVLGENNDNLDSIGCNIPQPSLLGDIDEGDLIKEENEIKQE